MLLACSEKTTLLCDKSQRGQYMLGFLIAIVAGVIAPNLIQPVARPIAMQLRRFIQIDEAEMPVIAVLAAMILVALIASVFNTGSPIGISLGLFIGYFGKRIFAAASAKRG